MCCLYDPDDLAKRKPEEPEPPPKPRNQRNQRTKNPAPTENQRNQESGRPKRPKDPENKRSQAKTKRTRKRPEPIRTEPPQGKPEKRKRPGKPGLPKKPRERQNQNPEGRNPKEEGNKKPTRAKQPEKEQREDHTEPPRHTRGEKAARTTRGGPRQNHRPSPGRHLLISHFSPRPGYVDELLRIEVAHVPRCSRCQCCKQQCIVLACPCQKTLKICFLLFFKNLECPWETS